MYQITDELATTSIDVEKPPLVMRYNNKNFFVIDVRRLKDDGSNRLIDYAEYILAANWFMKERPVVIGCDAGISRSNAIAVGVFTLYMNFYDALDRVKSKVPICNIDPSHIHALKLLFNVGPP